MHNIGTNIIGTHNLFRSIAEMCASDALCSCLTEDKENCKCKCSESSDSCKVDQEEVCTNPEPTTGQFILYIAIGQNQITFLAVDILLYNIRC